MKPKERSGGEDLVPGADTEPVASRTGSAASRRVTNNLVAIGSAAVLTVYAAGYVRTRAAAQRFSDDSVRRPAVSATATGNALAAPVRVEPAEPARSGAEVTTQAPVSEASPTLKIAASQPPKAKPATRDSTAVADAAPASSRSTDSTTAAVVAKPALPVAPPAYVTTAAGSAAQAADSTQGVIKPAPFKDGVYLGWGTSRFGNIQAAVEIKDGRIIFASIEQCMTRYPCSWVAALPAQVVTRQSAEVDYVSGATHSTNAFYYAVLEALSKAK